MSHLNDLAHPKAARYARVLTIAGSDSGGGAGIQADLKTIAALGCYGMTAITALTAQNTLGVRAIQGVPASFLKEQIAAVVEDIGVDAVKIGMLHAPDIVDAVAWAIDTYRLPNVVLDPVMVATSGDTLIEDATIERLVRELFPRATVVTPNLDEAALLLGRPLVQVDELEAAAADLLQRGAPAVLLKGGHLPGDVVTDLLAIRGEPPAYWIRLSGERIVSDNVHGT
ncbi:bifunctional hydroxymethylpyrimidine kinase/phosphomethylpyrimidine kinase, partial [uncultured Tepidimonas sp.]|uniref:bifunctional hydroxymethylpyrimidine kinase/phosphomethylpyrimidine kinase n=1 Tax=uncultured Tepidimonas sp. TaxID=453579 RepID=UPI00261DDA7F